MIQCSDCEHFSTGPGGQMNFNCNPFTNIKEPECLEKWQLAKLDLMVRAYHATIQMYQRLAPMQEKMFKQMEQELDDAGEADAWKRNQDEDEDNFNADHLP